MARSFLGKKAPMLLMAICNILEIQMYSSRLSHGADVCNGPEVVLLQKSLNADADGKRYFTLKKKLLKSLPAKHLRGILVEDEISQVSAKCPEYETCR